MRSQCSVTTINDQSPKKDDKYEYKSGTLMYTHYMFGGIVMNENPKNNHFNKFSNDLVIVE